MCEIWCFNVTHLNAARAGKRVCCIKCTTVIRKAQLYFIIWNNHFFQKLFSTLLKPSETAIAWIWLLYYCLLLFFGCCIRGLTWGMLHSNMRQHSGYVNRHVFLPLCICTTPEGSPFILQLTLKWRLCCSRVFFSVVECVFVFSWHIAFMSLKNLIENMK